MATKNDLIVTLRRTEELSKSVGLIREEDTLLIDEADRQTAHPWGVRLLRAQNRVSDELHFLPDSGRSIGRTKSEAQETLRTVNGVLLAVQTR